jgi:hypothetical protein
MNKWILSSEAMPENQDMECLIADKWGNYILGPYEERGDEVMSCLFQWNGYRWFHTYSRRWNCGPEDVYAWLEVPRTPREEEDNDREL